MYYLVKSIIIVNKLFYNNMIMKRFFLSEVNHCIKASVPSKCIVRLDSNFFIFYKLIILVVIKIVFNVDIILYIEREAKFFTVV